MVEMEKNQPINGKRGETGRLLPVLIRSAFDRLRDHPSRAAARVKGLNIRCNAT